MMSLEDYLITVMVFFVGILLVVIGLSLLAILYYVLYSMTRFVLSKMKRKDVRKRINPWLALLQSGSLHKK